MKSGYVRLGNKRRAAPGNRARRDRLDIGPRNPVLGNPYVLHDHRDVAARAEVIERYRERQRPTSGRRPHGRSERAAEPRRAFSGTRPQ